MVPVMGSEWRFVPAALGWSLAAGLALTLVFGFVGTWRALGQKSAPVLRAL
jgi:putative ABC transport system permease protein